MTLVKEMTEHKVVGLFPVPVIHIKFDRHHKYVFPILEEKDHKPKSWTMPLNTSFPNITEDDDLINLKTRDELKSDIYAYRFV